MPARIHTYFIKIPKYCLIGYRTYLARNQLRPDSHIQVQQLGSVYTNGPRPVCAIDWD